MQDIFRHTEDTFRHTGFFPLCGMHSAVRKTRSAVRKLLSVVWKIRSASRNFIPLYGGSFRRRKAITDMRKALTEWRKALTRWRKAVTLTHAEVANGTTENSNLYAESNTERTESHKPPAETACEARAATPPKRVEVEHTKSGKLQTMHRKLLYHCKSYIRFYLYLDKINATE